ncbi:putative nuclease HARBI1 [Stylophora pistillata]|uniref:Putative nuclease HARBI1 n=1 Tax=Stylophora pistillata TaxID=50429 RepID=A0A2B4S739_STYPI|nr:putative nuclease HARBI1 [Stylophora pistillata]
MASAKRKQIAVLCMVITFLDDEGEGLVKKKSPGRTWLRRRAERGSCAGILTELAAEDLPSFKHYLRMDVNSFRRLVEVVSPRIVKGNTRMRSPISPSERLALTLRFLATVETFRSLEFQFRVSRTAISYIVLEVCQAILSELGASCLQFPSTVEEWKATENKFSERWNFPHCAGALDGKHVVMQACGQYSQFYNYKGSHSIVLMVLAGPSYEIKADSLERNCLGLRRYEITWCNMGVNGRVSDGGVWNRTGLCNVLENGEIDLPLPEPLPNRREDCPYVIIGDDAFALKPFLMKPYPQQYLDLERRICNYRFFRARRRVENVFGLLANRWRIFRALIALQPNKVEIVTMAVVTLHNWLIKGSSKDVYVPPRVVDTVNPFTGEIVPGSWRDDGTPSQNLQPLAMLRYGNNPSNHAKRVRDEFNEYFNCEGQVGWQWEKCM